MATSDDGETARQPEDRRWLRRRPSPRALAVAGFAYVVAAALFLSGAYLGDGHWIAALVVCALGVWALAQLLDHGFSPRPPHAHQPPARRGAAADVGSIALTVIVWMLLAPGLISLWLALDVPIGLFGTPERVLLAPLVAVALVRLSLALRLRQFVSGVAIAFLIIGLFRSTEMGDSPIEIVAAAGPTQLSAALRNGSTIALASTRQDRGTPVAPIPTTPGMFCQRIEVRDQRRTLVGASAGRTEITSDTCWEADGTPFAVRVIASSDVGESMTAPRAIPVLGADAFDLPLLAEDVPEPAPSDRAEGSSRGPFGLRPFDANGRVRLDTHAGSPVLARVGRKGRQVELLLGWLRVEPAVRASSATTVASEGGVGSGLSRVSLFSSPARNEALDVFSVRGSFAGGPWARFMRLREGGDIRDLAITTGSTPVRPVPVGELRRERVVLRGGR